MKNRNIKKNLNSTSKFNRLSLVISILSLITTIGLSIYTIKHTENLKSKQSANVLYMDIQNYGLKTYSELNLYELKIRNLDDPNNKDHIKVGVSLSDSKLINNYYVYLADLVNVISQEDYNNITDLYNHFDIVIKAEQDFENEKDSKQRNFKEKFYFMSLQSMKKEFSRKEILESVEHLGKIADIKSNVINHIYK
ncbi:hypothetical protein N4T77_19045 [Clostridium sp. CX1]|uniref:hypothetical protein n=1 Tax=Clostridium sp. CX1 TaxID=2978346 RepID=UPI0021C14CE4|nr:hypothetical protein [Clostridium sp. CX1]MCT8978691.1 hypothetical protein [Clostridium sp. CX1]